MARYYVKPVMCDYAVTNGRCFICICNIRENAELIADILNADESEPTAYAYSRYKFSKFKITKREGTKNK